MATGSSAAPPVEQGALVTGAPRLTDGHGLQGLTVGHGALGVTGHGLVVGHGAANPVVVGQGLVVGHGAAAPVVIGQGLVVGHGAAAPVVVGHGVIPGHGAANPVTDGVICIICTLSFSQKCFLGTITGSVDDPIEAAPPVQGLQSDAAPPVTPGQTGM